MYEERKNNKLGFTLLELLVVVLIIGILAGIALPQYRRAKEKAEASELLITIKAVHQAQQRYFLTNGEYAEKFDDLDVNLGGYEKGGCQHLSMFPRTDCLSNSKNTIHISVHGSIFALRKTGKYKFAGFVFMAEGNENVPKDKLICYEYARRGFCAGLLNCDLIDNPNSANYYYSYLF